MKSKMYHTASVPRGSGNILPSQHWHGQWPVDAERVLRRCCPHHVLLQHQSRSGSQCGEGFNREKSSMYPTQAMQCFGVKKCSFLQTLASFEARTSNSIAAAFKVLIQALLVPHLPRRLPRQPGKNIELQRKWSQFKVIQPGHFASFNGFSASCFGACRFLRRGTTERAAEANPALQPAVPSTERSPLGQGGRGASLDSSGSSCFSCSASTGTAEGVRFCPQRVLSSQGQMQMLPLSQALILKAPALQENRCFRRGLSRKKAFR